MSLTLAEAEDRGPLTTNSRRVNLPAMFFALARSKVFLCGAVDESLRAEHGISLEVFDAMTLISEWSGECDEPRLGPALALPPDRARLLIDSLLANGYASRPEPPAGAEPTFVRLTLPGTLLLSRASRTVDHELNRIIGSVLSRLDIAELSDALTMIRQRSARFLTS
ncbi:MAG TPA: hypothetical protein VMF57_00565 [Solirubrobacteraceae bacterium]|nr:hypothetical protein [Solirubrobacteraceae bacterium]